jgi:hypothetical protein
MTKETKQHLDSIDLIDTPNLAFYELKLIVSMEEYDEADPITAGEWLINLLTLASDGVDIKHAAAEFLRCCITNEERRVHLCSVERIEA